jgi:hypothetical protein
MHPAASQTGEYPATWLQVQDVRNSDTVWCRQLAACTWWAWRRPCSTNVFEFQKDRMFAIREDQYCPRRTSDISQQDRRTRAVYYILISKPSQCARAAGVWLSCLSRSISVYGPSRPPTACALCRACTPAAGRPSLQRALSYGSLPILAQAQRRWRPGGARDVGRFSALQHLADREPLCVTIRGHARVPSPTLPEHIALDTSIRASGPCCQSQVRRRQAARCTWAANLHDTRDSQQGHA